MKLISSLTSRRSSADLGSTVSSEKSKWSLFRPSSPRSPQSSEVQHLRNEVQELKTRTQLQADELHEIKEELRKEESVSVEWRERWNYQNFKLQLLTDMWVLREIELECLKEGHPANLGDESILAKTASMSSCPSPTHTAPPAIEEPRRTSSAQRPSSGWTKEELPRESTGELIAKGNFDDLLVDSSFDGDEF